MDRYVHKKSGGTYSFIGKGKVQTDIPLVDYHNVTIYKSEKDGSLWVRPDSEFDQRFEKIDPTAPRYYSPELMPEEGKFLAESEMGNWYVVEKYDLQPDAVIIRATGSWWKPSRWMPLPD